MLCQYFSTSSPNFTAAFLSLLSASNKDTAMRWDAHILSWLLFNDTLNIFECVPNRLMRFSKVWQNLGEKLKPPCMKQRCVCVMCVRLLNQTILWLCFALSSCYCLAYTNCGNPFEFGTTRQFPNWYTKAISVVHHRSPFLESAHGAYKHFWH